MKVIEFDKLDIGFGKKRIISNLSAVISEGEFVGVFGPNGAGKTLLLRTILGLEEPLSGKVLLYGEPTHRGHPAIGYMPQLRHDFEGFSLTGKSYLAATMSGTGWGLPFLSKKYSQKIDNIVQLVGLEEVINRPFSQYSGGERQRLALAQALLGEPKILLLDEPLSSLDVGQQDKSVKLISSIQQQLDITVVITAHNVTPLMGVMTHIIYLAHGKAAIGTVDEVVNNKTLSWLYDTPVEVVRQGRNVVVLPKVAERDDHNDSH